MVLTDDTKQKLSKEELERMIEKSIKKVHGRKENDLCKYLPGSSGGYIHHFTMRKLKKIDPAQLFTLLQKFIVDKEAPRPLDPKPRAPRGSRKRRDLISFNRLDLEKVIDLARRAGDKDLLAKIAPKRPLTNLKRDLIRSIRHNQLNEELWHAYLEAITALKALESTI